MDLTIYEDVEEVTRITNSRHRDQVTIKFKDGSDLTLFDPDRKLTGEIYI